MSAAHAVASVAPLHRGLRVGSSLAREVFVALAEIPFVGPLLAVAAWSAVTLVAIARPVERQHPLDRRGPRASRAQWV